MKMAIRLNEFAQGLDHEITILDLKPRIITEVIEQQSVERQDESQYRNLPDPIHALVGRVLRASGFGGY